MASNYEKNRWELYNPNIPNDQQPDSFITKSKLEKMEQGIEEASIELEVGTIKKGDEFKAIIVEDEITKTRKINFVYPDFSNSNVMPGEDGKSAYEIWLELGNIGTKQEFIDYLKGIDGKDGKDGKDGADGAPGPKGESAYQTWLNLGNTGSESDFINSLKGKDGTPGEKGDPGEKGEQGIQGEKGNDGKSAYQIWLDLGNEGTEEDFVNSFIKGEKGDDGKSAYQSWLDMGNTGTEEDFVNSFGKGETGLSAYEHWLTLEGNDGKSEEEFFESLKGNDGVNGEKGEQGKSAYQNWLDLGNTGDEQDFVNSLQGEDGLSAYELWKLQDGNANKTITEFFESLKGEKGDPGKDGSGTGVSTEFVDFGS